MKTEGLPVTTVVERVNRISFASPLVVKLVDNFGARVNLGIKKKERKGKEKEKNGQSSDRWIDPTISPRIEATTNTQGRDRKTLRDDMEDSQTKGKGIT